MTTLATRAPASQTREESRAPLGASPHAVMTRPVPSQAGADEFSRAVIDSVVNRRGDTLSITVRSELEAISISSSLELLLLTVGMGTGSVSARVAPSFLGDTYPAMRALTGALDEAGLSGLWTGVGGRSIRLGEAWQMFISVDAPSARTIDGLPNRPDTLLEVVSAERVPTNWFRSRVAPRSSARGLTTAFYGVASRSDGGGESLFDRVRRSHLTKEWRDGVRRHFDTATGTTEVSNAS